MVTVGVDEVGRGCWAGPVVAAAVALSFPLPGLKDSKQLTKKARESLAQLIKQQALSYGIGWVEPAVIDEIGLTAAVRLGMERAMQAIAVPFDLLIIDGNYNFLPAYPAAQPVIRADATVPAVSAASILAKVARDDYMASQAELFPGYGFASNVGYGTASHIAQLKTAGITPLHRLSYKPIRALRAAGHAV